MKKYSISVSDTLDQFIQQQMSNSGYDNINDYIVDLLNNKRLKSLPKQLSDLEKLKLFNKKAERLAKYSLWKYLDENPPSMTITNNSFSQNFPTEESLDAVLITLRLFMQDNDHISIRNINKIYQSNSKLSSELKDKFVSLRKELNNLLDAKAPFAISSVIWLNERERKQTQFKNREILERILYGEIAHFTQIKDYKEISSTFVIEYVNYMNFYQIITEFKKAISYIANFNKEAISELES